MSNIKPNVKIDNATDETKVGVPEAAPEAPAIEPKPALAVSESPVVTGPEADAKTEQGTGGRRHSIMYIANGIWKDSKGVYWCREPHTNCIQSKTFSEEEFQARDDIKFMVKYGSMKDIVSE